MTALPQSVQAALADSVEAVAKVREAEANLESARIADVAARQTVEHDPCTAYLRMRAEEALDDSLHVAAGVCLSLLKEHGPALLAALENDARYRWWRENADCIAEDGDGVAGVAFSCQIQIHGRDVSTAELFDEIADIHLAQESVP